MIFHAIDNDRSLFSVLDECTHISIKLISLLWIHHGILPVFGAEYHMIQYLSVGIHRI